MEQEKEIVLGNKQLVSFFFVVLALCGVFFALGYMIRGNSLRQQSVAAASNPADEPPVAASPSPIPVTQESEPPRETVETPPVQTTAPVQPAPERPLGKPMEKPTDTAAASPPVQAAPLETGVSYLQVAALKRPDAENLVKTLREQSFPGLIEQSSRPDLFRVLVGPYRQVADLADAKAKLKALGFANAQVEKK